MEYKILTTDLHYGGDYQGVGRFCVIRDYNHYVNDNYDQHDNFGFYGSDIFDTFDHACLVIELLADQGEQDDETVERLVYDIRNYFRILYIWCDVDRIRTQYLIRAMMHLGLGEKLHGLIMQAYQTYEEECKEKEVYHKTLDFSELYAAYGDELLFREGRPSLALKYFELSALEWAQEGSEKEEEELLLQNREWRQKYREYRYYFEGKTCLLRKESKSVYEEYYNKIQQMLRQKDDRDEILNEMDCFFAEFTQLTEQEYEVHERRKLLFIAYRIREQGLLMALGRPGMEKDKEIQSYWMAVLNCVWKSESEELALIRAYANRNSRRITESYGMLYRILSLAQVSLCVNDIKECLLVRRGGPNIAYYTSLQTLGYLLPELDGKKNENPGKLSVMHIAYMNDPTEGKMLKRYLFPEVKTFDYTASGRRDAAYPYVFMKCFTPLIDDLPMWEMYGDHAMGCCVVLDRGRFLKAGGNTAQIPLYRICYLRKKKYGIAVEEKDNENITDIAEVKRLLQEIRGILDDDKRNKDWYLKVIEDIVYLFKDADYHHEQEARIVYQYHKHDAEIKHTAGMYPRLFIQPDFYPCVKEIILGPKFQGHAEKMPYLQEQLEILCETIGIPVPVISMSSIEYR